MKTHEIILIIQTKILSYKQKSCYSCETALKCRQLFIWACKFTQIYSRFAILCNLKLVFDLDHIFAKFFLFEWVIKHHKNIAEDSLIKWTIISVPWKRKVIMHVKVILDRQLAELLVQTRYCGIRRTSHYNSAGSKHRSRRLKSSIKKLFLKFRNIYRKTPVLQSLFNKVAVLRQLQLY